MLYLYLYCIWSQIVIDSGWKVQLNLIQILVFYLVLYLETNTSKATPHLTSFLLLSLSLSLSLYLYLYLHLYCICWEIARNTSVATRTCLHAHLTGSLPSTTPSRPACHRLKDKKKTDAWKMPLRHSFVWRRRENVKICPKDVRLLKMPLQKIPAETSCLFFVSHWVVVTC